MRALLATLLAVIVAGMAVAGVEIAIDRSNQPTGGTQRAARPVAVRIASVETAARVTRLEAVGTSRARRSIVLHPASAGEVAEVLFETDDLVEAGALLLRLDDRDEQLRVEAARLRLADARRRLDRLSAMRSGTVPQSSVEDADSAVQLARVDLARAEVALADRSLTAPFAGHLGLSDIDIGDRIDEDTVIATLDDRSRLLIGFDVPEDYLGQIDLGTTVEIAAWDADGVRTTGRIVEIGSRIDPVSRNIHVRTEVDNRDDRLRPGMSFRVGIEIAGRSYPLVPEIAVMWGADGAFLWAIRDGIARRLEVGIVQREAGSVLVTADVEAGEQVVVEGIQRLRDGAPVEIAADGGS